METVCIKTVLGPQNNLKLYNSSTKILFKKPYVQINKQSYGRTCKEGLSCTGEIGWS